MMESFIACRACLKTDVKLYDMNRYRLKTTYEELCCADVQESHLSLLPHHICSFCATLLTKFAAFKARCEQTLQLMEYLVTEHLPVTTEHVRKINTIHNIAPYTAHTIHNYDSTFTTEIKEEKNHDVINDGATENEFDEVIDSKEFNIDEICTDFQNDSDNEPLSKKVATKKHKKERKKMKDKIEFEENEFELTLLSKEQQIQEVLARKETANYINSVYKCDSCYKGFMTEGTYRNHMVRHDPLSGPETCGVCRTRWPHARARRAHALAAHARHYTCKRCGHVAKSHHKAKEHVQWHNGFQFTCKPCGLSFGKSTTYLTHVRLRHATDAAAACRVCGARFLTKQGLNMHWRKAHIAQGTESSVVYVECSVCDARFRNEEALSKHTSAAVDGVCDTQLRWCSRCGTGLPSEESLKQHEDTHVRENQARTCTDCGRTFAHERSLATHRARSHAARPLRLRDTCVCETCGTTCISRASLVHHQRRHTGEKPYQCSLCAKSFSVYQRLQIHIRTHTGESPFQCAVCPKAFKHKAALNRHDRVHSGERPYRCATCGKTFSQSNSMKQHAASVHLRAPLYARKPKPLTDTQIAYTQ